MDEALIEFFEKSFRDVIKILKGMSIVNAIRTFTIKSPIPKVIQLIPVP